MIAMERFILILISISYGVLIWVNLTWFCLAVHILLPCMILIVKLLLTMRVLTRFLFIALDTRMRSFSVFWSLILGGSFSIVVGVLPCATLFDESIPLMDRCLMKPLPFHAPKYSFLFVFGVIFANSLLFDVFCFFKIFNYMRKNSVRVMVVPLSASDRSKVHNVITAPSSLLIWLISVVSMLPGSLLMLISQSNVKTQDHLSILAYHLLFLFLFGTVVGLAYVGSSAELRHDVLLLQKWIGTVFGQSIKCEKDPISTTNSMDQYVHRSYVYSVSGQQNNDGWSENPLG